MSGGEGGDSPQLRLRQGLLRSCSLLARRRRGRSPKVAAALGDRKGHKRLPDHLSPPRKLRTPEKGWLNEGSCLYVSGTGREGETPPLLDAFLGVPTDASGRPDPMSTWTLDDYHRLLASQQSSPAARKNSPGRARGRPDRAGPPEGPVVPPPELMPLKGDLPQDLAMRRIEGKWGGGHRRPRTAGGGSPAPPSPKGASKVYEELREALAAFDSSNDLLAHTRKAAKEPPPCGHVLAQYGYVFENSGGRRKAAKGKRALKPPPSAKAERRRRSPAGGAAPESGHADGAPPLSPRKRGSQAGGESLRSLDSPRGASAPRARSARSRRTPLKEAPEAVAATPGEPQPQKAGATGVAPLSGDVIGGLDPSLLLSTSGESPMSTGTVGGARRPPAGAYLCTKLKIGFGTCVLTAATEKHLYILNGRLGKGVGALGDGGAPMLWEVDAANPSKPSKRLPGTPAALSDAQAMCATAEALYFVCGAAHGLHSDGTIWEYTIATKSCRPLRSVSKHPFGCYMAAIERRLYIACSRTGGAGCGALFALDLDRRAADECVRLALDEDDQQYWLQHHQPQPLCGCPDGDAARGRAASAASSMRLRGSLPGAPQRRLSLGANRGAFGHITAMAALNAKLYLCHEDAGVWEYDPANGVQRLIVADTPFTSPHLYCAPSPSGNRLVVICGGATPGLWEIDPAVYDAVISREVVDSKLEYVQALATCGGRLFAIHGDTHQPVASEADRGLWEYGTKQKENRNRGQSSGLARSAIPFADYVTAREICVKRDPGSDQIALTPEQFRSCVYEAQSRLHQPAVNHRLLDAVERDRNRHAVLDVAAVLRVVYSTLAWHEVKAAVKVQDEERQRREGGGRPAWMARYSKGYVDDLVRLFGYLGGAEDGVLTTEGVAKAMPSNAVLSKRDIEDVLQETEGGLTLESFASMFDEVNQAEREQRVAPVLYFQQDSTLIQQQNTAFSKRLNALLEPA